MWINAHGNNMRWKGNFVSIETDDMRNAIFGLSFSHIRSNLTNLIMVTFGGKLDVQIFYPWIRTHASVHVKRKNTNYFFSLSFKLEFIDMSLNKCYFHRFFFAYFFFWQNEDIKRHYIATCANARKFVRFVSTFYYYFFFFCVEWVKRALKIANARARARLLSRQKRCTCKALSSSSSLLSYTHTIIRQYNTIKTEIIISFLSCFAWTKRCSCCDEKTNGRARARNKKNIIVSEWETINHSDCRFNACAVPASYRWQLSSFSLFFFISF